MLSVPLRGEVLKPPKLITGVETKGATEFRTVGAESGIVFILGKENRGVGKGATTDLSTTEEPNDSILDNFSLSSRGAFNTNGAGLGVVGALSVARVAEDLVESSKLNIK